MGVPKYYRWLSERYPLINQAIYDAIRPEFDCMYLDMNGIIHVATHGPGVDPSKPLEDDAAMSSVFQYIDKVVRLGRPNRLLYMCLDGVAPRAKMNQQRQRRFRSAQDSAKVRAMAIEKGELDPEQQLFDSNCITPGTTFMAKLTEHLKFFIRKKIEEDPLWRQFTVLFSGHEVPGEAEHKIMRYIRTMKTAKNYDPNTRHLLYGLDADLIFLSLATHEPHFALLREEIVFGKPQEKEARKQVSNVDEFQLLHISILRDCLEHEFRSVEIPFGFDLERIIDDWVFIAFFIGNDFIPHLPSMDIHHGTLDQLIAVYKSLLPKFDGYMTDSGRIDIEKLEIMLHRLSEFELEILELQKRDAEYLNGKRGHSGSSRVERLLVAPDVTEPEPVEDNDESEFDDDDLNAAVRSLEIEDEDLKASYYVDKWFGLMDDPAQLDRLCQSYLEGLCWVLLYYYQGVPSWGWYYPYFYAPLASSMRNLSRFRIEFTLGEPFLPFEQLLGVLPPASAALIPQALGNLMTDPSSPIIDFYPSTFAIDMNGKKNDWEGIALIPFVDEQRLTACIRSLPKSQFTKEERFRNRHGEELTFRYDPKVAEPVQSSIPEIFASLEASHTRVAKFKFPAGVGSAPFRTHLCAGLKTPAPSFPSLNLLNITMALAHANVVIFGRNSKRESLVGSIVSDPSVSLLDFARSLIGKQCIVDWPFLRDALVVSATDGTKLYTSEAPDGKPLSLRDASIFTDTVADDRMKMLTSRAVDIGDEKVRVNVRLFTGMGRSNSGATHKIFAVETTSYPAQLVASSRSVADRRFDTAPAQSIKEAFPINCPIIYLGTPVELYGCAGVVLGHDSKFSASIRLSTFISEGDIKSCCRRVQAKEKWIPSFQAAQVLGLSPSLLGRISGAVLVNPGRANLGLNLKLVQRQMMVPGFSRIKSGTNGLWEYSEAALRLIDAYHLEFPELFSAVDDCSERVIDLRDHVDDAKEFIMKAQAWLKAQECSQLPLVPLTSYVLSPDAIAEIERVQGSLQRNQKQCEDVDLHNVAVQLLYKQAQRVQWSPTESQHFNLGDRVLFLGGHHGVPFGMRGNVVGVHEKELDIVFDKTILSGSDLNGRCSSSRGLTLAPKCLLNLSRPRVPPLHPKAPRPEVTPFVPRGSRPQTGKAASQQEPFAPKFIAARGSALPGPQATIKSHDESARPVRPPAAVSTHRRLSERDTDDESRDWSWMWARMQDPETAAKLDESRAKPVYDHTARSSSRFWSNPASQSSTRPMQRYQRHQPVPRAPVINPEHHRTGPHPKPDRYHPKESPTGGQRSGFFSTHSSMKTLFGLNESPTDTARRSLLPNQSPKQPENYYFAASTSARDVGSSNQNQRPPKAFPKSSLQNASVMQSNVNKNQSRNAATQSAEFSKAPRNSSENVSNRPPSRWRKKQDAAPSESVPNFRPFGSYGLFGQNPPVPPSSSVVRPRDLEQPRGNTDRT